MSALAAVLAAAGVAAFLLSRGPRPGPGPLACPSCGVLGLAFGVDAHEPFTYGLLVLRNSGDGTAVLDRVVPLGTSPGLRLVGAVALRTRDNPWNVTASDHHRFPPRNVASLVQPLRGYRIPPGGKADGHEVMLGFVVPSAGEFSFRRLAVEYHVGIRRHRAIFRFRLRVCAPARLHATDCEPPR
jgi:hypothetical protein